MAVLQLTALMIHVGLLPVPTILMQPAGPTTADHVGLTSSYQIEMSQPTAQVLPLCIFS